MSIDATDGTYAWPIDQVGPQHLPFHITNADGTSPDITAWTWNCEIWSAHADDGGTKVAEVTVTTDTTVTIPDVGSGTGTGGFGLLAVAAVDAVNVEPGMWFELTQLTPTHRPIIRGTTDARRRVVA